MELQWKIQEKRQENENKIKQKLTNKTNIGTPLKNLAEKTQKNKQFTFAPSPQPPLTLISFSSDEKCLQQIQNIFGYDELIALNWLD